jgi:hypothetical protein
MLVTMIRMVATSLGFSATPQTYAPIGPRCESYADLSPISDPNRRCYQIGGYL